MRGSRGAIRHPRWEDREGPSRKTCKGRRAAPRLVCSLPEFELRLRAASASSRIADASASRLSEENVSARLSSEVASLGRYASGRAGGPDNARHSGPGYVTRRPAAGRLARGWTADGVCRHGTWEVRGDRTRPRTGGSIAASSSRRRASAEGAAGLPSREAGSHDWAGTGRLLPAVSPP